MSECFIEITITLLNSLWLIFKASLTVTNYGGKMLRKLLSVGIAYEYISLEVICLPSLKNDSCKQRILAWFIR